jgi:hypothetical protein
MQKELSRTIALFGVLLVLGSIAYGLDGLARSRGMITQAPHVLRASQLSAAATSDSESTVQSFVSYYTDIFRTFAGTVVNYISGIFSTGTTPGIEGSAQVTSGNTLVSNSVSSGSAAESDGTSSQSEPDTITCTSQAGRTQTVSGAVYKCGSDGETVVTALAPSGAGTWVIVVGSDGSILQQLNCFDQPQDAPPYDFTGNQYCATYGYGSSREMGVGRYLVACLSTVGNPCSTPEPVVQTEQEPSTTTPPQQNEYVPVPTDDEAPSSAGNDATLTAIPLLVHQGDTTQVSWTSVNARTCTVTGTNGDEWKGVSGSKTSSAISHQVAYTLACVMNDDQHITRSTVVNIVPTFQER